MKLLTALALIATMWVMAVLTLDDPVKGELDTATLAGDEAFTLDESTLDNTEYRLGETPMFVVWMAPGGTGDGSEADPVGTLQQAHAVLCSEDPCEGLGQPVEIRIQEGVYQVGGVLWRYYDDEHPTSFIAQGDVVFNASEDRGLSFAPSRRSSTGKTNLHFDGIEWVGYNRGALQITRISGNPAPSSNSVTNNTFRQIGNYWNPEAIQGTYGLSLREVSDTLVEGNLFIDIINADPGHEHGIYAYQATDTVIRNNRFENIAGDPIRVRNQANNNLIEDNEFVNAGKAAYFSDWYRVPGRYDTAEYPSTGNVMRDNIYSGGFDDAEVLIVRCHDDPDGVCSSERVTVD